MNEGYQHRFHIVLNKMPNVFAAIHMHAILFLLDHKLLKATLPILQSFLLALYTATASKGGCWGISQANLGYVSTSSPSNSTSNSKQTKLKTHLDLFKTRQNQ